MAFLNKLMIHLNNATKFALEESNNTLDKKLYAFLCKMLETDADGKMICEEMRNLNENIVYFALNGTDIRNDERAFVAGLNWAKLDERLLEKSFLEGTALEGVAAKSETGNRTKLYSSKENLRKKKEDEQYINHCWNLVWEDYLQITLEEQKKNNLFTLNHWLLNKTKGPLNIGIYWGEQDEINEIDGGYFHLSNETLNRLGVLDVNKNNFNPLRLSREYLGKIPFDVDLIDIEKHMKEMEQDDEDLNNTSNIGFAVYHIIRSYGCWGGNSFYSIPINYGSAKEKRIGILSVCSDKPLSEKLIERWSLVANKIFKDIILHEIDLFKELERKATYSLTSHSLKTQLGTTVIKLKNSFKDRLKTHPSLVVDFQELNDEIDELYALASLHSLIDKIDNRSKFYESGFNSKLLTTTKTTYNLKEHLQKFNSRNKALPDIEINPDTEVFNLHLTVFELFFGETLLKLFLNTVFENLIAHGKCENNKIMLSIEAYNGYWRFSNETVDESYTFDEQKLKGNLKLFKMLIEDTKSGTFSITSKNYKFTIEIKPTNYE